MPNDYGQTPSRRNGAHFGGQATQAGAAPKRAPRFKTVAGDNGTGANTGAFSDAGVNPAANTGAPFAAAPQQTDTPRPVHPAPGSTGAISPVAGVQTARMSQASHRVSRRGGNPGGRRQPNNNGDDKRRRGILIGGIVAAIALVSVIGIIVVPKIFGSGSSDSQTIVAGNTVEIQIPTGSGASAIATLLYDNGVIASKSEFLSTMRRMGAEQSLKSGSFRFTTGASTSEIIDLLISGPNGSGLTLTIPEGYTVKAIASKVQDSQLGVSYDDFIAQAKASNYASEYSFLEGAQNDSLEGFLFPKTYTFDTGVTADTIIRTMLNQFQTELATLDLSYAQGRGLSVAELVNLASIVEKESDDNTRAQVAAVFYNRLNNMGEPNYGYLQSDATTAYSVGHDPSGDEVHDASDPYSTYSYQGLPPTPICNPGLAALQAVCSPDQQMIGDGYYYFYFWTQDGETQYAFSKTYAEHQQAIANAS